ncbi:MAG: AmmeMemoRadiSam system protein B [Planctomycetales bacterium 71-10]|nr:MAG: AmmeMemoRadiSam system protein B [Planctomycetales bacterium 71-10]
MPAPERPRLRRLTARRIPNNDPPLIILDDPQRFCPAPIVLPLELFECVVRHFNGLNRAEDVQRIARETAGRAVDLGLVRRLIADLDRSVAFEGPTFEAAVRAYHEAEVRPAALAGRSYESDPRRLGGQLDAYFKSRGGAGPLALPAPENGKADVGLRAVISPHIDFGRGGAAYTWAYKRLVEQSDAEVFIVLGVAHQYCPSRFILTRKDFATPLGVVRTDRGFVDRLAEATGGDPFADELTHRSEHSIEFQAVLLKHVLGDRPFTIVPILVGSFHDFVESRVDPITDPEVARFIAALRDVERGDGRKVAYVGGVDLCHVGPEFGDAEPVDAGFRERIRRFDREMLARAEASDPAGWFRTAAEVDDRWRVCGLAATYTLLHAIGPSRGELLRYDQAVDDGGRCCVTFASMAFHRTEAASI